MKLSAILKKALIINKSVREMLESDNWKVGTIIGNLIDLEENEKSFLINDDTVNLKNTKKYVEAYCFVENEKGMDDAFTKIEYARKLLKQNGCRKNICCAIKSKENKILYECIG